MSSPTTLSRLLRAVLLAVTLLFAATASAQGCIPEQEPNDTTAEATAITGAACVIGTLNGSDQDAFAWTVSEEDSQRPWRFELESIRGQLTTVEVFRVEFAPDGVDVTRADSLLKVGTPDGRTATSQPRLFAAGTYILGLSASGGEGAYSLALLPDAAPRSFRSSEPDAAEVVEVKDEFDAAGQLSSPQTYAWTVSEELADQLWKLELTAAVGETLKLSISRPDGSALTELQTGNAGSASVSGLGVVAGTYRLALTSASDVTAPFRLTTEAKGTATDGQEIEPNDSFATANVLVPGQEMRGSLSREGETDYFRFTIQPNQSTRLFDLETGTDENIDLCLLDANGKDLQCRSAEGVRLPALHLQEGDYAVMLRSRGGETDIPYVLIVRDVGEPLAGVATEPNDVAAQAFPVPESMNVRGELYGKDTDFLRVDITGEPQLWRVQAIGTGLKGLRYHTLGERSEHADKGESRLRLNNLYLLPGTHFISVSGDGGEYGVRFLPLDQPQDQTPLEAADSSGLPAGEALPEEELATLPRGPRPDGTMEREPNDDRSRAELLIFGEPRVGLLTSREDTDIYRFFLPAGQHVRLQVSPPADAEFSAQLYWGSGRLERAINAPGGVISGQEWLPAGDYHLQLSARTPSDEYYQVILERLDPFTVAPGRDADYREWFGRSADEGEEQDEDGDKQLAGPAELDVELELATTNASTVAAFWPYAQQLELTFTASNPGTESLELSLDWHSTDAGWHPSLPESLTLPAGKQKQLQVPLHVAPDAFDDPVVLTVRARAGDDRQKDDSQKTTTLTLTPDGLAEPLGSHLSWPVPDELLGGLNAAWLDLGAELVFASAEEEEVAVRQGMRWLFDGMTPLDHDYFNYRMWDRVPSGYGMKELLPTVRLAGSGPVEVAGFLLNPSTTEDLPKSLRDFAVYLSLDGTDYTKVFEGALSPRQVEQAFVLPEPVMARYARLELLSNQVPGAGPLDDDFRLGTFKVVTTSESAAIITGEAGVNIADPAVGGHVVWSDPPRVAHSNDMLLENGKYPQDRTAEGQENATWVIAFHNNRAAQITELTWADHPSSEEGDYYDIFKSVELSVATESPAGPWTPIGTWDLNRSDGVVQPFVLPEPEWARYVRFTATDLTPRQRYDYPELISIFERVPDDSYSSVLGEWGHYSRLGTYEHLHDQARVPTRTVNGNTTKATAEPLAPGALLQGSVELGVNEAWYRVTVPSDQNHLSVTLTGEPHRGFAHELTDEAGELVAAQQDATATTVVISASVAPGDYWLRVFEPPRSVVITWDTSGSVNAALPVIYQALASFAASISTGVEEVNLLPFDSPFLLRSWSGDPQRVLQAINDDPRNTSSSSGEAALLKASQALADRPGKKAVILLTDGAVPRELALWETSAGPH